MRGYNFSVGLSAGVFAFIHEYGRKLIDESFRVVPTMFHIKIEYRKWIPFL